MGHRLDVQVLDRDGDPVSGVKVKIVIDGEVKTVRVSVKAIRTGLAKRPVKRKPFQMPNL